MKTNLLAGLMVLTLLMTSLTGCVGYNTALFMTKSNAGLDFDSKPPTAEINISRKEGVVEPSFEGGKTPPVSASFSTRSGADDGLHRFFFGVNQTFAGGDAAVTMAKLYDDPTKLSDTDQTVRDRFDSKLELSQPPKANVSRGWLGWKKRMFGLAEPGEVRPFFFGTDTQLGVKVGWNGVGGPYPDNVKIGFNRKEIAVAPVTISNNVVRIPSFLATVDSGVNAGSGLGVSWLQYFATGESASFLARQYGVRKAMLERADPKADAAAEKFREFQNRFIDQKALYYQIIGFYKDPANAAKKAEVLKLAVNDHIVDKDTKLDNFEKEINLYVPGDATHTLALQKLLNEINNLK